MPFLSAEGTYMNICNGERVVSIKITCFLPWFTIHLENTTSLYCEMLTVTTIHWDLHSIIFLRSKTLELLYLAQSGSQPKQQEETFKDQLRFPAPVNAFAHWNYSIQLSILQSIVAFEIPTMNQRSWVKWNLHT